MKAILVTGAGKRIGSAVARELGRDGWFVFVHYNTSRAEAERVAAAIREAGGAAEAVGADLTDPDAIRRLVRDCSRLSAARGVAFSALVNNASLFEYDTVQTLTPESWQRHMDANLRAPIFLSQAFAAQVEAPEVGCIVNILDNKVFALNPDFFSYTISKVGLNGATEAMAMAFAPRVRVCGIAPGIVLRSGQQTEEDFERAHRNNPLERGASVEEVIAALRFILATPSFTGKTITIDGGQTLMRHPRDLAFL